MARLAVAAILNSEATNKMNIPCGASDFNVTLRSFKFRLVMKNIQKLGWRGQNCGSFANKIGQKIAKINFVYKNVFKLARNQKSLIYS